MRDFYKLLLGLFCCLALVHPACAQILDDDGDTAPAQNNIILDDSEDEEEVFNELFGDHPETERDITQIKNFNDALDVSVEMLKQRGATEPLPETQEEITPLEGGLLIGVTNDSFHIFKDANGIAACKFSVTLQSSLSKPLKTLGLNLIYPSRTFAFVFRDIPAGGAQERFIRTSGDICYNLTGAPDVTINKCKIYGSNGSECAARLNWTDDIKAPASEARDYFFHK